MKIGCLGEVIVDYIGVEGRPLAETRTFRQCAGGAAANVAVGLQTLGVAPVLMSRVGNDPAGRFLREELERRGVSTCYLGVDPDRPTRRAFIAYGANGRRDVDIVNRRSADQTLPLEDVADALHPPDAVLHVNGTAFLGEVTAATAGALARRVRAGGGWVSFDPNIPLDRIPPVAQERLVAFLGDVDLLASGPAEWAWIQRAAPASSFALRILTDGARGAWLTAGSESVHVPAPQTACVDPTGAGDAFLAGALAALVRLGGRMGEGDGVSLAAIGAAGAARAGEVIGRLGGH